MSNSETVVSRREFIAKVAVAVAAVGAGAVATGALSRPAHAMRMSRTLSMPMTAQQDTSKHVNSAGQIDMDGDYYKSVRRPPKPNAKPQLNDKQVEEFERNLACPCPCTLDVFTCRTTDFTCGNSPAVHRDVQAMVAGGYSADEIMQAMIGTYGNFILMAPPKTGYNLLAWFAPFAALGTGAIVVSAVLRGWRRNSKLAVAAASNRAATSLPDVGATDAEMARLRAALRDDSR